MWSFRWSWMPWTDLSRIITSPQTLYFLSVFLGPCFPITNSFPRFPLLRPWYLDMQSNDGSRGVVQKFNEKTWHPQLLRPGFSKWCFLSLVLDAFVTFACSFLEKKCSIHEERHLWLKKRYDIIGNLSAPNPKVCFAVKCILTLFLRNVDMFS